MKHIKKIIIWLIVAGIIYFFLGYHVIIVGSGVKLLKKTGYNLDYIVFNAKGKGNAIIMDIEELREAGIGELLVDEGVMSEGELKKLMLKYEEDDES
ncbi:MAG: hypothetical protein JRJ85_16000 [Deltaproteobacteria bacterium]|nr:hypothetical protein [Deltaproteobacteria bacterium]